jgi:hypothetical protein
MMDPLPANRPTISQVLEDQLFRNYISKPSIARIVTINTPASVNENALSIVKDAYNFMLTSLPSISSEVFFLATDLFYRSYHTIAGPITPVLILAWKSMMAACIWSAVKMLNGMNSEILKTILARVATPRDYVLRMESDIIITLKGDIHRPYIHDSVRNVGELVSAYKIYIESPPTYFTYRVGTSITPSSGSLATSTLPVTMEVFNKALHSLN